VNGFLIRFNATHVSILTSDISTAPYDAASQTYGTLPYRIENKFSMLAASVWILSPVIFSAQTYLTSELLRFL